MTTNELRRLRAERSNLKHQGRFAEAIPVQLKILAIVQYNGRVKDVSNAWNYLSMLYYRTGQYADAENASCESIAVYQRELKPVDETLACYEMLLAKIFAAQEKFVDAVSYGTMALEHYSTFHNPPDDFLSRIQNEVNLMVKYRDHQSPEAE